MPSKGDEPLVTIVIRVYHSNETLIRTLESLMNLDYEFSQIEINIVEDYDDEESEKAIKTFLETHPTYNEKIRIIQVNENAATKAWNKGIRESKGEIIMVLPDDVQVHTSTLKNALDLMNEDPRVAAVTFPGIPEKKGKILMKYKVNNMKFLGLRSTISSALLVTVYRKNALMVTGLFREDMGLPLSIHEDWELGSRIRKRGYRMLVDGTISQIHLEGRNTSFVDKREQIASRNILSLLLKNLRRYVREYIGKDWWSMLQVLKASPIDQLLEYFFYFVNPLMFLLLILINPFYSLVYGILILTFVIFYSFFKKYYQVFNLKQRLAYPLLVFFARSIRTYLTIIGFVINGFHSS